MVPEPPYPPRGPGPKKRAVLIRVPGLRCLSYSLGMEVGGHTQTLSEEEVWRGYLQALQKQRGDQQSRQKEGDSGNG